MTTRLLPPAEWPKLKGTEAESVWELLNPEGAAVFVVEDDAGQIVGCWILESVLHAECLWIHPGHRGKASVGRRLWAQMQRRVRAMGAEGFVTAADSDEVRHLLEHVGASCLGEAYLVKVGGTTVCQPQ